MNFKLDNWVEHPSFGRGQIREDRGNNVFIRFVDVGEKLLTKTATLTTCSAPAAEFSFPAPPRKARRTTKRVQTSLQPVVASKMAASPAKP
jgi:hypothetical protein